MPTTIGVVWKQKLFSLLYQDWLALLLILILAASLRFWQLGNYPPGLYHDEAYNGLDTLDVLAGDRPLFFPRNNGREPLYIYLSSVMVSQFGRTVFALRLSATIATTLTIVPLYGFCRRWFGRETAIFASLLWATTVWSVHLGRIGLRASLLPCLLTFAIWFLTLGYSDGQAQNKRWRMTIGALASGAIYGLAFYTYLSVRLTPLFLIIFLIYGAIWWRRHWSWTVILSFLIGWAIVLAPLVWLIWQQPALFFGRTSQVSIFDPAINQGDFWGTFGRHLISSLGMFFVRGDSIVRHNPPGRPIFDLFIALPFLIGVIDSLCRWRNWRAAFLLLWVGTMIWGTVLAEDAPHFLRSVGLLPIILIFPALGLSQLWNWSKLAPILRRGLVLLLLAGSVWMTIHDYFIIYVRNAETGYAFESAARELAEMVNQETPNTQLFIDHRLMENWVSLKFLVQDQEKISWIRPNQLPTSAKDKPATYYVWPYESYAFIEELLPATGTVSILQGGLAKADLDPNPYTLFVRYHFDPVPISSTLPIANFNDQFLLTHANWEVAGTELTLSLNWRRTDMADQPLTLFLHVVDKKSGQLISQADRPIGFGYWPLDWWHPQLLLYEQQTISLPHPFAPDKESVVLGLYNATTGIRVGMINQEKNLVGDSYQVTP